MLGLFLLKVVYLYILGLVLAIFEIQIEGKHGWAEKLPTWRPKRGTFINKLWTRFIKKDLTGYHLSLIFLLILFFHLPYIWGAEWNFLAELETIAFLVFFAAFWDFLWFVLNKDYPLKKFNVKHVWWHRSWWGVLPSDYYVATSITIALFIPAIIVNPLVGLYKLSILILGIIFLLALTMWVYPKTN